MQKYVELNVVNKSHHYSYSTGQYEFSNRRETIFYYDSVGKAALAALEFMHDRFSEYDPISIIEKNEIKWDLYNSEGAPALLKLTEGLPFREKVKFWNNRIDWANSWVKYAEVMAVGIK